jgi:hypothetical protein
MQREWQDLQEQQRQVDVQFGIIDQQIRDHPPPTRLEQLIEERSRLLQHARELARTRMYLRQAQEQEFRQDNPLVDVDGMFSEIEYDQYGPVNEKQGAGRINRKDYRPSPTVSATRYPNRRKKGNDGRFWISKPDKNGRYSWRPVSRKGAGFFGMLADPFGVVQGVRKLFGGKKLKAPPRLGMGGELYWNVQRGRKQAGLPFRRPRGGISIYEYTGQVKRFLDQNGDKKVIKVVVCKDPVQSFVSTALNLITLGQFDTVKNALGYDEMFHVYALCTMDTGEVFYVEKNQTILIGPATGEYLTPKESLETPAILVPTSLGNMLQKTQTLMGTERYFDYRGYDWNCQDFLLSFCEANGLQTPAVHDFLFQDAKAIFDNLPEFYKTIIKGVTDVAGIYDFATKD